MVPICAFWTPQRAASPRWLRYGVPSESTPMPIPLTSLASSMSKWKTPCEEVISFEGVFGATTLILLALRLISSGVFGETGGTKVKAFFESVIVQVLCDATTTCWTFFPAALQQLLLREELHRARRGPVSI